MIILKQIALVIGVVLVSVIAVFAEKNGYSLKNSSALPPDPSEKGEQTIEGIDSDGDGLRDDIQRYLFLMYPDDRATRAALTQYALELQKALLDAGDREKSYAHALEIDKAGNCLEYIDENSIYLPDEGNLVAQMLDTKARSIAYIRHNQDLGGRVFNIPILLEDLKKGCRFDVDALRGSPAKVDS